MMMELMILTKHMDNHKGKERSMKLLKKAVLELKIRKLAEKRVAQRKADRDNQKQPL